MPSHARRIRSRRDRTNKSIRATTGLEAGPRGRIFNVYKKPMNAFRMSIPPLPRFAGTVRRAFSKFAGFHRVRNGDAQDLLFAVGEAIANAIAHAQTSESIELHARAEGDAVVVRISDGGRGFTVPKDRGARLPHALAEHGRGFAIMQRCTDFFDVESRPGHGTVVTLGRYRRDPQELEPVS